MSDIDNNANIDKIKYILSRNGSLRFKKDIDDARTLLGSNNISVLNETEQKLSVKQNFLMGQLTNPFYSENDRETIYTYLGKLTEVIVLLRNRISQVANLPINTFSEVDGGSRKSRRRKSSRKSRSRKFRRKH